MLENACHELDLKGLIQGGLEYEHYRRTLRRDLQLREEMDRAKSYVRVLQQLVTLFTLATTNTPNPSHAANLAQLQRSMVDKKKELDEMVKTNTTNLHSTCALSLNLGEGEAAAPKCSSQSLQETRGPLCKGTG